MPSLKLNNQQIADLIRSDAPLAYQTVIPAATQAGMQAVADSVFRSRAHINEFTDGLVNRIGSVIGQEMSWRNPLALFKGGRIEYGDTIEEYHVNLLKVYSYEPEYDYAEREIFGQKTPDVQSIYHSISRQDRVDLTVNHAVLRRAFLEDGGLSGFIGNIMAAVETTDQWAEFTLMSRLLAQCEERGGFFRVKVPDLATAADTDSAAKEFLRLLREYGERLAFPSNLYNPSHRTVYARREDLIAFCTPRVRSVLDVNGLAPLFHLDKADPAIPVFTVPEGQLGLKADTQLVLTTKDFFRVHDVLIENTSIDNPVGLYKNYFFHHHEIISASLFVPVVAFATGAPTQVAAVSDTPQPITAVALAGGASGPLRVGQTYQMVIQHEGNEVADPRVAWSVSGALSPATRITRHGVLRIGRDESATEITVSARPLRSTAQGKGTKVAVTPAPQIYQVIGD